MKRKLLLMIAACAAGASAQDVRVDYDHAANFDAYHTFAWRPVHGAAKANGVVDNTLLETRLERAVDAQLVSKGFTEASGKPDVYLEYHVGARNVVDRYVSPGYWGPGWGWRRRPYYWGAPAVTSNRYTEGTVVVDMIDARTNQLLWRAYAHDTGNNPMDANSEKHLKKIAEKAFQHFPPHHAA